MISPLADRFRLVTRYWFVLPPLVLLVGLFVLLAHAWNAEPPARQVSAAPPAPRTERPQPAAVLPAVSVFFVVDCSRYVPSDLTPDGTDRRRQRIRRFINDSAAVRARLGRDDRLGVITFSHQAHEVVSLSPVGQVCLGDADLHADPDPGDSDLGDALALALKKMPDAGPRRIVLISAGVDRVGDARHQLTRLRAEGIQIDVLPLGDDVRGLALLEEMRAQTETDGLRVQGELRSLIGKAYRDEDAALDEAARYGDVFRPLPSLPAPAPKAPREPHRPYRLAA
jgi:hypothetical protein